MIVSEIPIAAHQPSDPRAVNAVNQDAVNKERPGRLIINADDWGRDRNTTDRTLACFECGALSSVSAMVFMEDSERAASIARERKIDSGLHLNLTLAFSQAGTSRNLLEHQQRASRYLRRHRLGYVVFHPGLKKSFQYLVDAQLEEFERLYGKKPGRIDGHHHAHLCANVVFGRLLPEGTILRRNFSFERGEKSFLNRLYRKTIDRTISHRHRLADFFYSLPPLEPRERLQKIFRLAGQSIVEVETHPVCEEEYRFLAEGEIFRWTDNVTIAHSYVVAGRGV